MACRLLLVLSLVTVLALPAGAVAAKKTSTVSEWSGSVSVDTILSASEETVDYADPGELEGRELETTDAKHRMAGTFTGLRVPRKPHRRAFGLAGGGNLRHWPGMWSTYARHTSGGATTYERSCRGVWRTNARPDTGIPLQVFPHGTGAIRLDVAVHIVSRNPACSGAPGPEEHGPQADGWPEDFTLPLPPAAHTRPSIKLSIDRWSWSASCGDGEERTGTGAIPAPVRVVHRGGECTAGASTLRRVTVTMRRTCRTRVVRPVSSTGSTSRCVRKR